jgi:DNA-binding NtrC family response regulator
LHGTIEASAMELLRRYEWPGNVRQLSNVLESAVAEASGNMIGPADVREVLTGIDIAETCYDDRSQEANSLRARLLDLIATHRGDANAVAAAIGVSRATIYRHMQRLGVRTGKRKVSTLPDETRRTADDTRTRVSNVSLPPENFSRQLRLVRDDTMTTDGITMG